MIWQNERHILSNSKSWSFFKKLKRGNSHSLSTIQSPIQSHTWIELNPHSYLLTFWAWSNIIAFREMSWSLSTLVSHCARSSIKSVKSGSLEPLHPPEKKRKRDKSEWAYNLTRAKKKRTKGKDGEAKVKHHSKGHSSLTHTCTWPSSKDDMISQRQDFWSCKINEENMYFTTTMSYTNVRFAPHPVWDTGRGSHQKALSTIYTIRRAHQSPASGDELHGGPFASSAFSEPDERAWAHGAPRHPGDNQEPVLSIGANPGESHRGSCTAF